MTQPPPPTSGCYPPDSTEVPSTPGDFEEGPYYPATIVGSGNVLADHDDATYAELLSWITEFGSNRYGRVIAEYPSLAATGDAHVQMRVKLLDATYISQLQVNYFNFDTFTAATWVAYQAGVDETLVEGVTTWLEQDLEFPWHFEAGQHVRFFVTAIPTSTVGSTPVPLADVFEFELCIGGVVLAPTVYVPAAVAHPSLRMLQRGGTGGMSGIWRMVGNPTSRDSLRRGPGSIF